MLGRCDGNLDSALFCRDNEAWEYSSYSLIQITKQRIGIEENEQSLYAAKFPAPHINQNK